MLKSSFPCSPFCPGVHMDQDTGDTAITGNIIPASSTSPSLIRCPCAPRAAQGLSPHTGTSAPAKHQQKICLSGKHQMSAALLALQRVLPVQEFYLIHLLLSGCTVPKLWDFFSSQCPDHVQLPQKCFLVFDFSLAHSHKQG